MKKLVLSALVLGSAFAAAPAFAQASGSVDVSGTVAARCSAATPISGSITLGELAKTDGTVDAAFSSNVNGLTRNFTIKCNGSNPKVSVEAKPLVNAASNNPPNGYTNTVHYTAVVTAMKANGGTTNISDDSMAGGATSNPVGDRLAPVTNNISLTVGSGKTNDSAAMLEAGAYAGKVEITVAPTA
ncbi:hypothetical protein DMC47_24440 [Nostoc sp. 3335mG]|nr:hypothetical protein DMC47_24440 [Nostoc sp. 3335mG]